MSETKIVKLLNYMAKFLLIDRIKVVLKSVDNPNLMGNDPSL